jgi:hypothetical protein
MPAANLQLSRNTHVYLEKDQTNLTTLVGGTAIADQGTHLWQIPVLDGFSFSQSVATSEIALNEMAKNTALETRRGRAMFNDALEPAEWSFTTYARPTSIGGAVEEALWASFIGNTTFVANASPTTSPGDWRRLSDDGNAGVTRSTSAPVSATFDFEDSNTVELGTFNLYFVLGGCAPGANDAAFASPNGQTVYKMSNCVVNSATVEFDIDGITQITWSGFGTLLEQIAMSTTGATIYDTAFNASSALKVGTTTTDNFIKNRLTTLAVTTTNLDQDPGAPNEYDDTYSLTLTGGSITFENNITFLTPEELCRVNVPIGHVTGTRSISGAFTCYLDDSGLKTDAGLSANAGTGTIHTSSELFRDLSASTGVTSNRFDLSFSVGGSLAPRVEFNFDNCHLEIPTHGIEDVISLETNWHALPSSLDTADEATVTYVYSA